MRDVSRAAGVVVRWPRILPPQPHTPIVAAAGHAWCQNCRTWKPFDVIPANTQHDIPARTICTRCGTWIADYDLEAS